jgi:hypothetical protein
MYRVGSVNADVQPVPVQHHIMATQRQGCITTYNSYYHKSLRWMSKQDTAKLLVYLEYLTGALMMRVLDAFCGG